MQRLSLRKFDYLSFVDSCFLFSFMIVVPFYFDSEKFLSETCYFNAEALRVVLSVAEVAEFVPTIVPVVVRPYSCF